MNSIVIETFGQRPTPPVGATIKEIRINSDEHNGHFDRIKNRYVWTPFADINFLGRMGHQPMSVPYFYRGRIAWIQPVSYRAEDTSIHTFDSNIKDDAPLKSFILTPFAQCAHLHVAYATVGMRILEHLKDVDPEIVTRIESVLMPTVPTTLVEMGNYLMNEAEGNIKAAFERGTLSAEEMRLAQLTLAEFIQGVRVANNYCRNHIAEVEGEILTRRNKGIGKASMDDADRYAYFMQNRQVPTEATLENSGEARTNELLTTLVNQLASRLPGSVPHPAATSTANSEEVTALKTQLAEMNARLEKFAALIPPVAPAGAPVAEQDEPTESIEEAPKPTTGSSLKNKLENLNNRNQ